MAVVSKRRAHGLASRSNMPIRMLLPTDNGPLAPTACQTLQVVMSVIGRNCKIGRGAHITGSYLHDNVVVEDGARITEALLCESSTVMADAVINPGAILSFKAWAAVFCFPTLLFW